MSFMENSTFNFDIIFLSPQCGFEEVSINKEMIIAKKHDIYDYYNPFSEDDIIPSLIKTVEQFRAGKNSKKLVREWVKKWGLLKGENIDLDVETFTFSEPLNVFWEEMNRFFDLWQLYKYMIGKAEANYNSNFSISKIKEEEIGLYAEEIQMFVKRPTHKIILFKETSYEAAELFWVGENDNLLTRGKMCALQYIADYVSKKIHNNFELRWGALDFNVESNQDGFKSTPSITTKYLLDALYMKFFVILNNTNQKICFCCNTLFTPTRKDKIYCSDACKQTAKSRRYYHRKRKD